MSVVGKNSHKSALVIEKLDYKAIRPYIFKNERRMSLKELHYIFLIYWGLIHRKKGKRHALSIPPPLQSYLWLLLLTFLFKCHLDVERGFLRYNLNVLDLLTCHSLIRFFPEFIKIDKGGINHTIIPWYHP